MTTTSNHDSTAPNTTLSTLSIVLTAILLLLVTIGTWFFYKETLSMELNKKQQTAMPEELRALRLYEAEQLSSLSYIDNSKTRIRIPIDVAMKIVVEDYKASKN